MSLVTLSVTLLVTLLVTLAVTLAVLTEAIQQYPSALRCACPVSVLEAVLLPLALASRLP
jgi:hypothetical protein